MAKKKKTTPKQNAVRAKAADFKSFVEKPNTKLVLGLFLIFLGIYLAASFISYLSSWAYDQSFMGQSFAEVMSRPELQAKNAFGKIGAGIAHQFIHRWFGAAAFIVPWLFVLIGLRLSLNFKRIPLSRALASALFFLIWLPTSFAAIVPFQKQWAGAIGYFFDQWLQSLAGPLGSILVLTLSLLVFLSIRFKWTSETLVNFFQQFKRESQETKADAQEEQAVMTAAEEHAEDIVPQKEQAAPSFDLVDDYLEADSEQENPEPEPEIELELEEEPSSSIELEAKPKPKMEEVKLEDDTAFEIEQKEEEEALSEKELNRKVKEFGEYDPTLDLSRFKLPTLELLKDFGSTNITINEEELSENKNKIVNTLNNYKIEIAKIKATIGPTVTLYEIVPAPGVRISKIKNLEDDIALSLSALGIRIIAPIPGRGTIGIEVPNTNPQMVPMRNLIAGEKFQESNMELPIAFGKTISNETYVADLAKMPHLLMAGATGQGKSVGLNVILTSLLYKKHPSQVKFVLVDPKKVELTLFNKIERHYLAKLPDTEEAIITDTTKVINTLNSLCIEMDDRYELLKNAMVRNIKEYNAKFIQRKLNPEEGHRYLPYIVLVIDEFADLIMTAGKEVETPIARLAQLARAIGIHLIVATQRPSVNVITGIIKANFPARCAFRVTSKIDSRTILDAGGAEQLIGKGDMLLSQGSDLIRLQCAFVDTPEVENITDYIGSQQAYPEAYQLPEYKGADEDGNVGVDLLDPSERDALFEDAARLVIQSQQGSTSMLQRKLKLGYNRAGRIVDQLEAAGIIGPFEGSKAREVLLPDEYALEQLLNNEGNKE